jgi:hypothetical protein
MAMPRVRFTIRRLLVMIVAAALLLAGFVGIRDWQRRQARIQQLRSEILVNDLAEAQAGVMVKHAKRKNDPQGAREHEHTQALLREQGRALREKLSRFQ